MKVGRRPCYVELKRQARALIKYRRANSTDGIFYDLARVQLVNYRHQHCGFDIEFTNSTTLHFYCASGIGLRLVVNCLRFCLLGYKYTHGDSSQSPILNHSPRDVCVCVRACVRACVCVCVRVCVTFLLLHSVLLYLETYLFLQSVSACYAQGHG